MVKIARILPLLLIFLSPGARSQNSSRRDRRTLNASRLVSQEKKSPTTPENAPQRYAALLDFVRRSGNPDQYMPQKTAERITNLLDGNDQEEAARLVHSAILDLEKSRNNEEDGMRNIKKLVEQEKTAPTTEKNIAPRRLALIRAMVKSGGAIRYVKPGETAPMEELLFQNDFVGAAAELHGIITRIGQRFSSLTPEAERPASPTEADKTDASTFYFKALQNYADGKLDSALKLLRDGAKLDPTNQDIATALKRLDKER